MQPLHALLRRVATKSFTPLAVFFLLFAVCFSQAALAHNPTEPFDDIELKVWSSQSFDNPFCSDDPIDMYFRVNRAGYITVYQINPYGGVEILYPLACHRWQPIYPGRTYRLTDISADLDFLYNGLEGNAYIGIVATRQPIDIVPWLEAGFRDHGLVFGRPARVTVGVDFHLVLDRVFADVRVRLGTACVASHYVAPIYVRPRVVMHRPPVIVWPTPPRHKSYPPKWGNRDEVYYPPQPHPEPPEKRPIRRRGNEASDTYRAPHDKKPKDDERSHPDRSASKRGEEVKVKNDSGNSGKGESSGSERRTKKPRN